MYYLHIPLDLPTFRVFTLDPVIRHPCSPHLRMELADHTKYKVLVQNQEEFGCSVNIEQVSLIFR